MQQAQTYLSLGFIVDILQATAPIFILLLLSEFLWRAKILRGEAARKLLHIVIGSYVALWPYFLTFRTIQLLALAMFIVVALSHRFKLFHAINDVHRKTKGDLLYAVGIGLVASLTHSPWIFAVAVLHMSVADGLAGLVGSRYGKTSGYKIFGYQKSAIGTATFVVSSFFILAMLSPFHPFATPAIVVAFLPFAAAALENIGVRGTDNVLIPLLIVAIFTIS